MKTDRIFLNKSLLNPHSHILGLLGMRRCNLALTTLRLTLQLREVLKCAQLQMHEPEILTREQISQKHQVSTKYGLERTNF